MNQSAFFGNIVEKTWKQFENVLRSMGFKTTFLDSEKALKRFIYETIPDNCIVALSNKLATNTLKIREILLEKGNRVYYSWNEINFNRSIDTFEDHPQPEYLLAIADSISTEGDIIGDVFLNPELPEKQLPKNIIAFSNSSNLIDNKSTGGIKKIKPDKKSAITIAIVPFLKAS